MAGSSPSRHDALSLVVPASSMPVFAHERVLPVPEALKALFSLPGESHESSPVGLVRGQTVVCTGSAAMSCALGLAAGATQSGSWAAFVGLPSVGLLAAATIGVSLERAVFLDRLDRPSRVDGSTTTTENVGADGARGDAGAALSALVDGFDLVVLSRRLLGALSPSLARRLQSRAQSKGSILVVIGEPQSVSTDLRLTARAVHWEGVGDGHGHLRRRLVSIEMDGRRCPRRRDHVVWLPDAVGGLSPADDSSFDDRESSRSSIESEGAVVISLRRDRRSRGHGS